MEKTEKQRLWEEAQKLIELSEYSDDEKRNLSENISNFLSMVENENILKDTQWSYFDYAKEYDDKDEEGKGLDLCWNWENVKGVFGFYTNNSHGFSFDFGENNTHCMFGGEDGEHGFSCDIFLNDFERALKNMGY